MFKFGKTAAIHNLGCKVNSYEAESMERLLQEAGYHIVPFDGEILADVYIVNTCSVTNIADRKSRQMLHRARKRNPDAVIVAAGCYAQADGAKVLAEDGVDLVIGNNCKINIVEALAEYFDSRASKSYLVDMQQKQQYEQLFVDRVSGHTRAYVKIQDGCNQFCSYCIIPYTRGRIRSRALSDILEEIRRLAENGYQEVVLTGIHLSSYGVDNGKGNLLEVLTAVHEIEGISRIRLGSLEPRIITEAFVSAISRLSKLCPHFHLSLQSGCDTTLARMNRHYTTAEYEEKCALLRQYFDNPAITTDVIVGFPGETEAEFEETKAFLEKISLYEMHIFKYSGRKGTAADKMPDQLADCVKNERSRVLLALADKLSEEYRLKSVGKRVQVLIEEKTVAETAYGGSLTKQEVYSGYTDNYIKVQIPCSALTGDAAKEDTTEDENKAQKDKSAIQNRLVWCTIIGTDTKNGALWGQVIR